MNFTKMKKKKCRKQKSNNKLSSYEYLFWRRSLRVLTVPENPGSGSFATSLSCLDNIIRA